MVTNELEQEEALKERDDVTNRRRLKGTIVFERELLEAVERCLGVGLAVISRDFRVLWANRQMREVFGDVENERCYRAYHERSEVCENCGVREIFETGKEQVTRDESHKDANGNVAWAQLIVNPIKDEHGNVTAALELAVPITERKRLENELRQYSEHLEELIETRTAELKASEEKFRAITERSFDLIITVDPQGRITYASPSSFFMTGYSPEQLIGKLFTNYVPEDEAAKLVQAFARVAGGEVGRGLESKILGADGSVVHVEIVGSPIIGIGGAVTAVQAIVRDITERRRLEEMKDQFVSHVAHELRTPLASITGYLDLTLSDTKALPKEVESNLHVVKRNADLLLSLTNDLLDIQRMQAGRLQLNMQPLNLHEIITQTVKEIKPLMDKKKQNLTLKIPEKLIPIEGDPTRLTQVLVNLLSNASKFAPESGKIALITSETEETIQVQVSDNGIGIKPEDLERIFQPFALILKPSYFQGTGLGLSITRGLVEAHGGKISAESGGPGKGATFTFTIPKRKP